MKQQYEKGWKLKRLAMALAVALPIAGFAQSAAAETLEFKRCVELTLNQNPETAVSAFRIEQAKSAYQEASSSRLPQITASFTASNSDNPLNVFGMKLQQRDASFADFGFAEFDSTNPNLLNVVPDDLNHPDARTDFNTRLEMLIPVYNGGKISSYQKQAKSMIDAAQHGDEAVRQMLTFNVYKAYEAVHTARAYIEVAQKAVLAADSYVKTTANLVEQGVLVRSELLSAKVNQSNARMALEKAQNQEKVALESLKMLMAMDSVQTLDIGKRVDMEMPADNLDDMIAMALAKNPQLEAKRYQVNSSYAAVGASKAGLYPSFNVMARQDWNDDQVGFNNASYTVAGVVSWKITDFGVTSSGVDKANAAAKAEEYQLRSQENQVRLNLITAWNNLDVAKKQVHVNQLAVEQAEEAQRLVLKRYKNGVATMTEVLASQALLDKARAEVVAATYEKNIQTATLRLQTGTMQLELL
ncbi:TolC family protein [Thiomicrorhabdus sp. zzn3]|uniref:TolC family protein n=1 Tax=Thiomicrorhabdus sp. zzn3 TaxID=3039775 RepID=UPI0024369BA8|nr:TolC family protein [Thiomicrorhabdus sp. zzn3]MDG6779054.1 TolC family protein [Thiomicrorhabdus sp. zzn3]